MHSTQDFVNNEDQDAYSVRENENELHINNSGMSELNKKLQLPNVELSTLSHTQEQEFNELNKLIRKINELQEFYLLEDLAKPVTNAGADADEDTIVKDLKKELENEKKANHSLKNELLKTREQIKNYSKINILIKELFGLEVADCIEDEDGYRFNCKNTGRRGTLEYQLLLDDQNFTFTPRLNVQTDEELMKHLPDYLLEEIIFTKEQGKLFSARLMKALQD
ncbi:Monopolin complex subunit pcs1 [Schizosaccharomyces pombe]